MRNLGSRDWTTAIIDTEDYPEALIITHIVSNFSSLIKEFPLGNLAQNIEISITGLEMTRKIYSREVFPLNWARTQHNLGNAYRDRIFGDETENIKQGLAFYHNALEVFTPEEFPEDWARTKNNLAMAYAQWIGELKLDSESTQGIKGFLESYDSDEKPFESPFYWAAFCAIGK